MLESENMKGHNMGHNAISNSTAAIIVLVRDVNANLEDQTKRFEQRFASLGEKIEESDKAV